MDDLVTAEDLARARKDPAFRQQFLAENLDRLQQSGGSRRSKVA